LSLSSLHRLLAIAFVLIALSTGLVVLSAEPALATTTPVGEYRASGSAAGLTALVGIETRLSDDAVRENVGLAYDIAPDHAVAARGASGVGDALKGLPAGRSAGVKIVHSADELNGL
jgi:hypothetical protein